MTTLETTPPVTAPALDYVRDLVTLLARYYRDLGMNPLTATQAALKEFQADYPDEIRHLAAAETDDG